MVKALLAVLAVLRSVWLLEAFGAGLIVWGVYEGAGHAWAAVAAGAFLLLKAFEKDLKAGDGS